MKLKKLTSLFLTGLLSISLLAGCNSSTDNSNDSTADNKPTVVDIFQFKVEFKDQFEALAKEYEKEHEGVKINITTVGGGDDYGAALRSKFASGNEPAIFNVGGPQDIKDWQSKLTDLSDTKASNKAFKGTLDPVTREGKILGLPFNEEGYGFIYNKSVFEKAGIDPKSLDSYAKFEEAVKTLDSKKEDLGLKSVFAFAGKETWVTGLHLSNLFISPEFDENIVSTFDSKTLDFKYSQAMKKIVDLQNKYSVQPTISLDYSQQVEELFSMGKVAMIKQGNWVYKSIADIDQEFADNNIGIIPVPVDGYKSDSIAVGIPMYWAVNNTKDDAVIKASKDFIDWMYTSETGKEYVLTKFNFIPAYEGYDTSKLTDPLSIEIANYIKEDKIINWVFMGYPSGWGMNNLGANLQKYLGGNASWEEVIDTAKEAWAEERAE